MLRAKLKQLLLDEGENQQDLFTFVDSALQGNVPERKAVLEVESLMFRSWFWFFL